MESSETPVLYTGRTVPKMLSFTKAGNEVEHSMSHVVQIYLNWNSFVTSSDEVR